MSLSLQGTGAITGTTSLSFTGGTGMVNSTWTTGGRPNSATTGQQGFNTDLGVLEAWNGSAWVPFAGAGQSSTNTFTGTNTFNGPVVVGNTLSANGSVGTACQVFVSRGAGLSPTWTTLSTSAFAAGTKLMFPQTAAPTGWTQCTSLNDYALRIVNTAGGGTGGSINFSSLFSSSASLSLTGGSTGPTTLSVCQMPSHAHDIRGTVSAASGSAGVYYTGSSSGTQSAATGGGLSHTHPFTGTTATANMAVKYVDTIIATKN